MTVKKTTKKTTKKVAKKKATRKKVVGGRANNGGARKGSGRKFGACTVRTREIADKLASEKGATPLDYMLRVLRDTTDAVKARFEAGEIDEQQYTVEIIKLQSRQDWAAQQAAPYIHPKLSSIDAKVSVSKQEDWLTVIAKDL